MSQRWIVQRQPRVLLIEHSEAELHSMERALRDRYAVVAVDNAVTALRFLARCTSYDGVIYDLGMSQADDLSVYERLVEHWPGCFSTRVLLLGDPNAIRDRALVLGGSVPVLLRPFAAADLLDAVALITSATPAAPAGRREGAQPCFACERTGS